MSAGLEDVVLNFEEFPDVSLVRLSELSYYLFSFPLEIISYEVVTTFLPSPMNDNSNKITN